MADCIRTPYALNRPNGYGHTYVDGTAHNHSRVVYVEHRGLKMADIAGKLVRHTCNNSWCIQPEHLILGTEKQNMQDKMAVGNWRGGQPKKLTAEQVACIRKDFRNSTLIAKEYNVSRGTIDNVKNYKSCYKD